jgi:hypothetical protein
MQYCRSVASTRYRRGQLCRVLVLIAAAAATGCPLIAAAALPQAQTRQPRQLMLSSAGVARCRRSRVGR